ncbi:hypothetical protein DL96DRAFT_1609607 [Flagelloscypha sp. PMI_526]|nr:hypothetical protein DL96DRAFT_1609607 [Flagelloscypha sp. PMI_526]
MPAIQAPAKVLVTGANGYIAVWVVKYLLDQGYSVRGTVRSESKAAHLREFFKSFGDKFELAIVPDITVEGAFDEAVKGMDAIEHTASPFHLNADDPDELIKPAVEGTVGILKSTLAHAPTVKRVVVTSSVAAIIENQDTPRVFTEEDWNDQAVNWTKKDGRNAPNGMKYRASKTLAEKAAWELHKTHAPSWDLVTLNPPFVLGPLLQDVSSPAELNTSSKAFYDAVVANLRTPEELVASTGAWIDVRDLALAHRRALEVEEAGGNRILIVKEAFCWQEFLDAANKVNPSSTRKLPVGTPGKYATQHLITYNTDKEKRIFGLQLSDKEKLARDILTDFDQKGW